MSKTITLRKFHGIDRAKAQSSLERQSDCGLFPLHDQVGKDSSEESPRALRGGYPCIGIAYAVLLGVALLAASEMTANDRSSELGLQRVYDGRVAVGDIDSEDVPGGLPSLRPNDRDAAVRVEQTGDVSRVQHGSLLSAYDGMVANSVELRCPARKGAEGQYRAKQESDGSLGVCNEHVPPAKAKMCSGLMGNHERATEMIAPAMTTEGYCRHQYRVKASNNIGDRQCPTGRAYLLRKEDTFFMVDPRFLFEWTAPLTYPDQMAFTRLCGLRFFLLTNRRMFEAVYDGVTA